MDCPSSLIYNLYISSYHSFGKLQSSRGFHGGGAGVQCTGLCLRGMRVFPLLTINEAFVGTDKPFFARLGVMTGPAPPGVKCSDRLDFFLRASQLTNDDYSTTVFFIFQSVLLHAVTSLSNRRRQNSRCAVYSVIRFVY